MASTYSTNLKLELIGNGDQSGTWGTTTNTNLGTLLEQAITGITTVDVFAGDTILTNLNGVSDQARNAIINVIGTISAEHTIYVPNGQTKTYIILNNTAGGYNVNVQTLASGGSGGTGLAAVIPFGASILIYCTGTNCYTVAPYTAYTAVPIVAQGYAAGTALTITSVSSGTLAPGQTIYNPGILWTTSGFPSGTTIVSQTSSSEPLGALGGKGVYVINNASTVGAAAYPQTIVALKTLTQIATVDYVQSKMQSPYFQGSPSADTPNAAAYEGTIGLSSSTTGIMLASQYYIPASPDGTGGYSNTLQLGQYINGFAVSDGTYIKSWGTGTNGNAAFTGYISNGSGGAGTTLTVTSGSVTGTITNSQYLAANSAPTLTVNTKITGGSGLTWTVDKSQLLGSATSPVSFNAYGPLTNQTDAINAAVAATGLNAGGWVNVQNDSLFGMATAVRTPMISYLSPLQLTNVLWAANISSLIGTLGTQNDNAVNILGGTISGVTISNLLSALGVINGGTGLQSLTPNSVVTGGSTSTGAVAAVRPGTLGNVLTSTAGATVNATALVTGVQYSILVVGTTDFTLIGASANTVGVVFTATGVGTGTGTAQITTWASVAASGLGVGQTWQNVTGSRAVNTDYTNGTGKPIQVVISMVSQNGAGTGNTSTATALVGGVTVAYGQNSDSSGFYTTPITFSFIVPAGTVYRVNTTAGSGTSVSVQQWAELR